MNLGRDIHYSGAPLTCGRHDRLRTPGGRLCLGPLDESPRRDTSAERLASLRPVFSDDGATTAGNAPGINDGAAALVLASESWAKQHGHTPLARIISEGHKGVRINLVPPATYAEKTKK